MTICRHFVVSGRVQGVAFRASTVAEARRLGVTGWVRNLPNGDVEVLASGEDHAVRALESWLWRGPRAARVTAVRLGEAPAQTFADFEIR